MSKWTGRTKGNLLGYQIIVRILKIFGLKVTYFFLRFVSYYYYAFVAAPRDHLTKFYRECLGVSRDEAKKITKKNFYVLAQSLVDRIAFTLGKGGSYHFTNVNEDKLKEIANRGDGLVLISAHYGNWDIAGQMLGPINKINVLMFENEHEKIKGYLDSLGKQNYNIIPQKNDMSHLIKVYGAIKKGEVICMHADRYVGDSATYELDFFDHKAYFPKGPFQIISKLKVPVAFVFTQKLDDFSYHYSAHIPNLEESNKPEILAQQFANVLEDKVKEKPDHWFNYFEFHHTK